ncbi:MAG: hypothetical protein ACI8RD_001272 [Bacillariaceae sp.]|jgi:hypothetical protein
MMTTDIDPGTATTTTNSMNRGRGIVNMDRRKSKKRRENLSAISELSCNDVVVSPYEIATSPSVCGTEIIDRNEQELMIKIYSPSDTIISPLTCSIQSSLSSSSSSLFLPNDGAMSTLSKGSLETTQNEDEMEEIHPEVDTIDQISKTPAGEQAHAKNEENISTIFLTADRLEKGKSFVNFQRPRRKPLRDRSDIFQTLNNQDGDVTPRMEFHHELSPGVIVPGSIALSPLHSQNNANTCRQEEHNGLQSSDDTIEDGFYLWDNSSPDLHQKKITTLNSQRFSCPNNELRIEKKTNNCSSDVVNISQWTETNNSPSNVAIFIPMKGRKGRRLSSCYSLPLVNIEDDLNRMKSNNTTSRLTNIFEDEPVLTTLLEESHQSCDERGKHNQEQLDYVSTKNRKSLHCVSLADYEKRISPFRNVFEEVRSNFDPVRAIML